MADEVQFQEHTGYLEARCAGAYSVGGLKRQVTLAVKECLDRNLSGLLVDITGLSEFVPSTLDRFELGKHAAEISRTLRVAALGTPHQLGDLFASKVARNRGMSVEVFDDRAEAVRWLLDPAS